jgi:hypothetical protein
MADCQQHIIKKVAGGYLKCETCGSFFAEYDRAQNMMSNIHKLQKENKQLKSCLKMLKFGLSTSKIADKYIEKDLTYTILCDRVKDKKIIKDICFMLNITCFEEESEG